MSADEDHLGLLDLVRPPRLLGRRELDLVVHALVRVRVKVRVRVRVRVRVKG